MWDTKTLALIKTIPVEGRPDGILSDAYNHRIYVFSHSAPNATVLDATDGSVLGTIDLGAHPNRPPRTAKAISMSILKIKTPSRWWMRRP